MTTQLFATKTVAFSSGSFESEGRRFATLLAKGTWDGALVKVEASPDDGTTWITTTVQLTTDGVANFIAGKGVLYRVSISNPGASTSLSAWVAFES